MSDAVVMYACTLTSPDLYHAVPVNILDPVAYLETAEERFVVVGPLDANRVARAGIKVIDPSDYGRDALRAAGRSTRQADVAVLCNVSVDLGLEKVVVPSDFPLDAANALRERGIAVAVDQSVFERRRRVKSSDLLEGIRRVEEVARDAMTLAGRLIRELRPGLTSAEVRAAMRTLCDDRGVDLPADVVVAGGAQAVLGHEPGRGGLVRGETVIVDIWPRERSSRANADIARTFIAGGGPPDDEVKRYWQVVRDSIDAARSEVRAGASCMDIYRAACGPFDHAGIATRASVPDTADGFTHYLGHGVGLEVHEAPFLGPGPDTLVAGDVITIEPGCYRPGFGGVRFEDMLLVTADGSETLTTLTYDV